jgi:putative endonuclease
MSEEYYWVYILHCENGAYYTGYTDNLIRRYHMHKTGKASKYTRSFKPIGVAQCWQILGTKGLAMQIESFIKRLSKQKKIQVILNPELLIKLFGEYHS